MQRPTMIPGIPNIIEELTTATLTPRVVAETQSTRETLLTSLRDIPRDITELSRWLATIDISPQSTETVDIKSSPKPDHGCEEDNPK